MHGADPRRITRGEIASVQRLDPGSLPSGEKVRMWVELAQDGLGRPIRVPVLAARGIREGPVFGLTAAIHGNEVNGIPVLHRLFERLDPRAVRGTVIAVPVLNVPGFLAGRREFHEGSDLNRIMPGHPDGGPAEVYAHRILERIIRPFDYLLDLHTASAGRANSLYVRADMTQETPARMAYRIRPQIIVHNEPSDATLRGAADELGIPAITVEIGDPARFQRRFIAAALAGVRAVMGSVGVVPRKVRAPRSAPVLCCRSIWIRTERGGLLDVLPDVADTVSEGDVIARVRDPFGDLLQEYRAPFDGVVVGKERNPVTASGGRVLHLGERADPDDSRFQRPEAGLEPTHGAPPPLAPEPT